MSFSLRTWLLSLGLMLVTTLSAEISVGSINLGSTSCSSSFIVTASGSAGPFDVTVTHTNSGQSIIFLDIQGDLNLTDQCNGQYQILVVPTRFPSCATTLTLPLVQPKSNNEDGKSLFVAENMKLELTPNPSNGVVLLSLSLHEGLGKLTGESSWSIQVLNNNGQVLRRLKHMAGPTSKELIRKELDLRDLPPGLYRVRIVEQQNGTEITGNIVLQ